MTIKLAWGPGWAYQTVKTWYCDICWQRGVITPFATDKELLRAGNKHQCRFIPTKGQCILRTDLNIEHRSVNIMMPNEPITGEDLQMSAAVLESAAEVVDNHDLTDDAKGLRRVATTLNQLAPIADALKDGNTAEAIRLLTEQAGGLPMFTPPSDV